MYCRILGYVNFDQDCTMLPLPSQSVLLSAFMCANLEHVSSTNGSLQSGNYPADMTNVLDESKSRCML